MNTKPLVVLICTFGFACHSLAGGEETALRTTLSSHGITEIAADRIVACFHQADRNGLPTESLYAKLREGIVKQADAETMFAVLERHLQALTQANKLMPATHRSRRRGSMRNTGLDILARVLESGLPPDVLEGIFTNEPEGLPQRSQAIVEAVEMLHLSGIDKEDIRLFVVDCRHRNPQRMATLRAARFWISHHREGMETDDIRKQLWGETPVHAAGSGRGGDGQRRQRRGNNIRRKASEY